MKLKPCPFCVDGGKPRLKQSLLVCPEKFVWVECEFCGVSITPELSEENAVKTWNTRYIEDNAPLTLEELREMEGEPYWHVGLQKDSPSPHWNILDPLYARHIEDYCYGKQWLAYRRKPVEGTT